MCEFPRLLYIETIKLRRSPTAKFVYLLPLIFIAFDFWFFRRSWLGLREISPAGHLALEVAPIRIMATIWAGFFQPLLLVLLPALLVRPEHRFKLRKHLHAQPISPGYLYFIKVVTLLILMSVVLGLVELGLWTEGALLGRFHPILASPFLWMETAKVLGWMFLGSMPLLALYLWLSSRLDHGAVPVALGLIGLVLSIALSRGDMNPPWQRDLIPWVLPYVCTQRAVERHDARQDVHVVAVRYKSSTVDDSKTIRMIKAGLTERTLPWVFPPPTPTWQLVVFSLTAWMIFTLYGVFDIGRNRS